MAHIPKRKATIVKYHRIQQRYKFLHDVELKRRDYCIKAIMKEFFIDNIESVWRILATDVSGLMLKFEKPTSERLEKYKLIQRRYNELHQVKRKRRDDCIEMIMEEFFIEDAENVGLILVADLKKMANDIEKQNLVKLEKNNLLVAEKPKRTRPYIS